MNIFTLTSTSPTPPPPPPQPTSIFQTYLLPSLPFRRRKSSSTSTFAATSPPTFTPPATSPASSYSSTSESAYPSAEQFTGAYTRRKSSFGAPYTQTYLSGNTSHISCARCHADLALTSQIVSKGFTGRHGRAYLVAPSPSSWSPNPTANNQTANSPPTSPSETTNPNSPSPSPPQQPTPPSHHRTPWTPATPLTLPPHLITLNPSLLPSLPNTHTHKPVPRHLVTGLHTVCDISCALCGSVLGWKYVAAEDEAQKYKIGKFILETRRVVVGSCWENFEGESEVLDEEWEEDVDELGGVTKGRRGSLRRGSSGMRRGSGNTKEEDERDEEVLFDSEDEDECEDLFAGVWSPQLASRRRSRRMSARQ